MPILVHLADERDAAHIRKNGLKIGKYREGIYCMPVLPNFYVSHQWLRELKRSGARTFVGVYFKIDSEALVYAGKYNDEHRHITLGDAIKEIMSLEDPLGYELIIHRKIAAKEIDKIRVLPQTLGWRYSPKSKHNKPNCACPFCIPRGSIKGKRLRDKIEPPEKEIGYYAAIANMRASNDDKEIDRMLLNINRIKRGHDPADLLFLLDRNSDDINQSLAFVLKDFKHRNTQSILLKLLTSNDKLTKQYATDSLLNLYGQEIEKTLMDMNDPVINASIDEWKN